MNKRYWIPALGVALLTALGISSLSLGAGITPATCAGLLNLQPSYNNCQNNASTIRQCIQNSLASQITSSGSLSNQLQASSNASQSLAQLDFQCQFYLSYGGPMSSANPSKGNGALGSAPKTVGGSASAPVPNAAVTNQSTQLNKIPAAKAPANNTQPQPQNKNSNTKNNNSLINWF